MILDSNSQIVRLEADSEYYEKFRAADRERKQKQRDAWTPGERQAYNAKKNEYQKEKRSHESEIEREARLHADRDSHWQRRQELGKVVSGYAARFQAANKHRQEKPQECDMTKPLSVPYLNEAEEKAVEDYLDRRDADTERRRLLKDAMSKDELQNFLDKNAKWHRDRRAVETEQRVAKRIAHYEMRAKSDNKDLKDRIYWLAEIEREKLKHQSLRAPDSRSLLLSQESALDNIIQSIAMPNTSKVDENKTEKNDPRTIDEAFLKEVIDAIIDDPQIGNEM